MVYINTSNGEKETIIETIDEFETRKEARAMLKEYRLCMPGPVWISQRACKGWNKPIPQARPRGIITGGKGINAPLSKGNV